MLKIGYLTINGTNDPKVVIGPSDHPLADETIEVIEVRHAIRREVDTRRGAIVGNRAHPPFTIIKPVDIASPRLYQMCFGAERIPSMKLQYYIEEAGGNPIPFFSWELFDAYVAAVESIPPSDLGKEYEEQYDLIERVEFIFQKIKLEHSAHTSPLTQAQLAYNSHEMSFSG